MAQIPRDNVPDPLPAESDLSSDIRASSATAAPPTAAPAHLRQRPSDRGRPRAAAPAPSVFPLLDRRANGHRSATLDLEQVSSTVSRDPGTARRPFRKSSRNMRSITTVRSLPGTVTAPGAAPRTAVPSGRAGAMTMAARSKKRPAGWSPFAGIARIRSLGVAVQPVSCPASQPFLPDPGLPGTPFGPAPSITSQTKLRLHGTDDGRLGTKAPTCTGQTTWLRRSYGSDPAPGPGALYGIPGRQPQTPPSSAQSGQRGGCPRPRGPAAFMLPGSYPQDHSLAVAVSGVENRTIHGMITSGGPGRAGTAR